MLDSPNTEINFNSVLWFPNSKIVIIENADSHKRYIENGSKTFIILLVTARAAILYKSKTTVKTCLKIFLSLLNHLIRLIINFFNSKLVMIHQRLFHILLTRHIESMNYAFYIRNRKQKGNIYYYSFYCF